jgi:hypothetical protein
VFKYTESQQLSYLACNLLSEVICGPHVKKFGTPGLDLHNQATTRCRYASVSVFTSASELKLLVPHIIQQPSYLDAYNIKQKLC